MKIFFIQLCLNKNKKFLKGSGISFVNTPLFTKLTPRSDLNGALFSCKGKKAGVEGGKSAQIILIIQLQYRHKCGLRNLYPTDLLHLFLTFFLFFKKFTLTGNIATITFCGNVFS